MIGESTQFYAEDKDPYIAVSYYSIYPHDSASGRLTFILAAPTTQLPCSEAGQEVNESSCWFMLGCIIFFFLFLIPSNEWYSRASSHKGSQLQAFFFT